MSIHLYKTHIRPHLERTYPIWCGANLTHKVKVDRVHQQALIRASGAMSTTATADLEVLLHIEPIRCRLDEVLMQEYTRVMSKKPGHHLHNLLEELPKDEAFMDHRIITPIHTEDNLFSRVEQAPPAPLNGQLTKPLSSEALVLGLAWEFQVTHSSPGCPF